MISIVMLNVAMSSVLGPSNSTNLKALTTLPDNSIYYMVLM